MNRAILAMTTTLLLLLWPVPGLEAAAYKCILTNTCKPPPCEFMRELKDSRATVRALAKSPAADSSSEKALNRFLGSFDAHLRKARAKYSKCPSYEGPRALLPGPKPSCEIRVFTGPGSRGPQTSLAEELRVASTCSEAVEAEFRRAEAQQGFCLQFAKPVTVLGMKPRWQLAEQAKAEALEASLFRYLASCAPKSAKLSREIAQAGLNGLKQAAAKVRNEWKAKQAAAGTGGGR